MHRVLGGAVAQGDRRDGGDLGGEQVLAQDRGVPLDVDDSGGHGYAPTSA